MGFDKLTAPFAGEPLARRVARALAALEPLFVATASVVDAVRDLEGVRFVVTDPTAGPAATLRLAHGAVASGLSLAVVPCDLPFLDAAHVRAFVARAPDDADLAWPLVGGVPGHPVVWSPRARARIASLRGDEPPSALRGDPSLRAVALEERDDAYVTDVDTREAWRAAEMRATSGRC